MFSRVDLSDDPWIELFVWGRVTPPVSAKRAQSRLPGLRCFLVIGARPR